MATKTQVNIEYLKETGNQEAEVAWYPEASSQSFKKGQLVYLASGKVTACATNAVVVWGVATSAASGTVDTLIGVITLTTNSVLSACVYNATAASAITAVALVGLKQPLVVASNKCYVDNTSQATPCFVVYGIDSRDTVGDIYGRYLVKMISTTLQSIVGA